MRAQNSLMDPSPKPYLEILLEVNLNGRRFIAKENPTYGPGLNGPNLALNLCSLTKYLMIFRFAARKTTTNK